MSAPGGVVAERHGIVILEQRAEVHAVEVAVDKPDAQWFVRFGSARRRGNRLSGRAGGDPRIGAVRNRGAGQGRNDRDDGRRECEAATKFPRHVTLLRPPNPISKHLTGG